MAAIFSAQLSEFGTYYMVNNIILTEVKYVIPSAKYVDLSTEVALKLKNDLNQGKVIKIEKDPIDYPQPLVKDLPYELFQITVPDTLEQKKSAVKAKIHQKVSTYTALLTGFDLLEFWIISGKLQSYGHNVMDNANKEEVYLSIINTGNEDLISDLERFLELKDVFDSMIKKYRGLKKYIRDVDECDSEQELEEVQQSNHGWLVN